MGKKREDRAGGGRGATKPPQGPAEGRKCLHEFEAKYNVLVVRVGRGSSERRPPKAAERTRAESHANYLTNSTITHRVSEGRRRRPSERGNVIRNASERISFLDRVCSGRTDAEGVRAAVAVERADGGRRLERRDGAQRRHLAREQPAVRGDQALEPRVVVQLGRDRLDRAGEVVGDREDVAGKAGNARQKREAALSRS